VKTQQKKKQTAGISALGRRVTSFERLETFPKPAGLSKVTLNSDEITAFCPVTAQPDFYAVSIEYVPNKLCVESKTVKLYLQRLRSVGKFCEALSAEIARDFSVALGVPVRATMTQKSRGGVSLVAESYVDASAE